jgi:superfamily I DNA and RNA helicase
MRNIDFRGKFIATEAFNQAGEKGEEQVWNSICQAFAERDCLAYWRYPIFLPSEGIRREPDILILDAELGLIVIEVKSIYINQIIAIAGHVWQAQDFYTTAINPYQQAEQQLFALLKHCQSETALKNCISGRVLVALPQINQQDWQQRGFDQLPSCPPILFQDLIEIQHQDKFAFEILETIIKTPTLVSGKLLSAQQWKLLKSVISGTPLFQPPSRQFFFSKTQHQSETKPRSAILAQVRKYLTDLDFNQEKIGKQIPPGPQRICGIAGSGKTVLLCQKAAIMHLKHPDWKIAVVFFTRSLSDAITQQLDRWLRHFSNHQIGYDPNNSHLQVLHAWGSKKQPGFYSGLCKIADFYPFKVETNDRLKPNQSLARLCSQLLESATIPQYFDGILIDESQDLLVEDNFKFEDKQPFFWMAYQSLKKVNKSNGNPSKKILKRLIWAGDEFQCLTSGKMLTARELFGENWEDLVSSQYPNEINQTERMMRCYRTPESILTVAHGISMGLLRSQGLLVGLNCGADWEAMGYQVTAKSRKFQPFQVGEKITLHYSSDVYKHPIYKFWKQPIIQLKIYHSRQAELTALAENILYNLKKDGLRPSREILVIILGNTAQAMQLECYVAQFLIQQGIDIFIPGAPDCNILKFTHQDADYHRFWSEGGVTISRTHRAKGNEADMVYIVGLDRVAEQEYSWYLRQQLFIALTRSRGWVHLSGTGAYPFYQELWQVMKSQGKLTFTVQQKPKKLMSLTAVSELLKRYHLGERCFQSADLSGVNLPGVCLDHINLTGANLMGANLTATTFDEAQLRVADLTATQLSYGSFHRAKMMGATLYKAQLNHGNFNGADLRNTDLRMAQLVGTSLQDANLEGANLMDAHLVNTNLKGANLTDAILPEIKGSILS